MATSSASFTQFHLDDRLVRATLRAKFPAPTPVQSQVIPLAVQGKDVLCRARTGSGKTAAYTLPILNKILQMQMNGAEKERCVKAVILLPTRELCQQVRDHIRTMCFYCMQDVTFLDLSVDMPNKVVKILLHETPDIIISTPSRLMMYLEAKHFNLNSVEVLVIDEADLVLSYGYDDDVRKLMAHLPSIYQGMLMSATLSEDVDQLQHLVLKEPAIIKLEETKSELTEKLTQYAIRCNDEDKFLMLYFMLKMKLLPGKSLIFVNNIERCFRIKLLLQHFLIRSSVLNAELPHNSRVHIVQEFNRGAVPILIATDAGHIDTTENEPSKKKKKSTTTTDSEYGVARGVDFQGVEVVYNFDFPTSTTSYVHRVGRTARGVATGSAVSFVCPEDLTVYNDVLTNSELGKGIKPFQFKMEDVNGLRYRVDDALQLVTRSKIKEAQVEQVKHEILNSEKLKAHFEDNPNDLQALKHDNHIGNSPLQSHLKHLPAYLIPSGIGATMKKVNTDPTSHVPFHVAKHRRASKKSAGARKHKQDPLKSFHYKQQQKKKGGKGSKGKKSV